MEDINIIVEELKIADRIKYLYDNTEDDKIKSEIDKYAKIYLETEAACFGYGSSAKEANNINDKALEEIDKIFYNKYNIHIVKHAHEIGKHSFEENS